MPVIACIRVFPATRIINSRIKTLLNIYMPDKLSRNCLLNLFSKYSGKVLILAFRKAGVKSSPMIVSITVEKIIYTTGRRESEKADVSPRKYGLKKLVVSNDAPSTNQCVLLFERK